MAGIEYVSADFPELGNVLDGGRKLAILGLPWDTSEDTLRSYFSQFGSLEHVEVMKDRYTGKSRGFGFISFMEHPAALRALNAEHLIDGRRCEAKVALPKGEPSTPRTTRIFVARIPPSVTEPQFRAYFEAFGKIQDAYMPKDHSKQGYRGIGFVTFASPDTVEKIVALKHFMNGHEIAVDRATPKDEPSALKSSMFSRVPMGPPQRRSFDNGAGIIGPGLMNVGMMNVGGPGGGMAGGYMHVSGGGAHGGGGGGGGFSVHHHPGIRASFDLHGASYSGGIRSLSGDTRDGGTSVAGMAAAAAAAAQQLAMSGGRLDTVMEMMAAGAGAGSVGVDGGAGGGYSAAEASAQQGLAHQLAAAAAAANAHLALQSLKLQQQQQQQQQSGGGGGGGVGGMDQHHQNSSSGVHGLGHHTVALLSNEHISATLLSNALNGRAGLPSQHPGSAPQVPHIPPHEMNAAVQHLILSAAVQNQQQGRRSLDVDAAQLKRLGLDGGGSTGGGGGSGHIRSSLGLESSPAIVSARAGPRIFVGKLTKETSEGDVKEYFGRFGYVMDVYLPKAKDNKTEHRGFGFVTFETEAAIQRVVQHGSHRLKGSTIAIDIAMPKVEEEGLMLDSGGLDGGGGMAVGRPSLNGNSPAGGVTFPHHGGGSSSGSMGQQPLGLQQQLDLLQRL